MEMLSSEPDIIQVYDILNDDMIQETLAAAQPVMDSSRVVDKVDPKLTHISTVRTSRQAWLSDWYHPRLSHLSKTVERITGMEVASSQASEKLQVLSYSFGGHYEPHVDALKKKDAYGPTGDRILTFMFYMSDVTAGGYTSFTNVGIAARPMKGSAVFWFNLYEDGYTDEPVSQHGGCPVILGRKNAANKWVRLYEQFQTRKCNAKQPKVLHRAKINGVVRDA
jgi:prolyl 4-hydroxylase